MKLLGLSFCAFMTDALVTPRCLVMTLILKQQLPHPETLPGVLGSQYSSPTHSKAAQSLFSKILNFLNFLKVFFSKNHTTEKEQRNVSYTLA